tara:strand:+ start:1049 stop:1414 length:366 start_codon:yes stop_codon:yes gene_type:complete
MKKIFFLLFLVLFTTNTFSQNTFRLCYFNAKDGAEESIGDLMTKPNQNTEFKSCGIQVETISFGDNKWKHSVVSFGEVVKIGRTDLKEFQQGLFLEQLYNLVEEWGSFIRRKISYLCRGST